MAQRRRDTISSGFPSRPKEEDEQSEKIKFIVVDCFREDGV